MIKKILNIIELPNWLVATLGGVLLFRIPSFFEPYSYGDEMIYLTLGNAIRRGLTLYQQIHDNKPPLLYLTAAVAGNLFWFKAILCFWMLGTTIAFWHLVKNLFKENKLAQKISVIIFAILTTIPLFEGNIVNAELFLIGPIIIALTILLTKPTYKNIFLSGILFAIATLFKVPAAFDLLAIVAFWLIVTKLDKHEIIEIAKKTLVLALGFAVPILITLIWFFLRNALPDYVNIAFLQNIGYISSWGGNANLSFLTKHGPLILRASIVLIGFAALKLSQKKLGKTFILACIWFLTSLFAVTLSERPYPHYMIQAIPSLSILITILLTSSKIEQVFTIIPLTIAIFVPIYYKFYYYPTSSYYLRFIQFAVGQISKTQYLNKFDQNTVSNYEVSQIIIKSTTADDKIFVWGDAAPIIYALSRRLPPIKYVADYHISDFSSQEETVQNLSKNPPILIVILSNASKSTQLQNLISKKYVLISSSSNTQIWHLW